MTLHWWMHWFWVTMLLILLGSESAFGAPQSEELLHITTELETERHSERQNRALYISKTVIITTPHPLAKNITLNNQTDEPILATNVTQVNVTEIVHPAIQWTAANANVTVQNSTVNATLTTNVTDDVTTTPSNANNLTREEYIKDLTHIEGIPDSRIVTEKPLSLETAFSHTRIPNVESSRRMVEEERGIDTGVIAGIAFAGVVLAALAGSIAFVLYRRRYLNKPQTLNDKCSNPDSSGYLDDSTVRDNSEEMYSLDNDSFLNSLEAMTIQNYWTDTVKHTKL